MSLSAQKIQKLKYDLHNLTQSKQYTKIEKLYAKYKGQKINDVDIWRHFAGALSERGDFTSLASCCKKILRNTADDFHATYALAIALQNTNQLEQAIKQYKRAIEIKPEYIDANINLAQLLHTIGDYNAALQQLRHILSKQSNNNKAIFLSAQCCYEQCNYAESEKHYLHFITLEKNNFNAINNLGRVYEEAGRPQLAIDKFNEALKINETVAITHLNLGKVLVKTEMFTEAEIEFLRLIELEPGHPEGYFNLGKIYNNRNEINTAKSYFLKALDADISIFMAKPDEFIRAVKFFLANIDDPELFNEDKKEFVADLFDGYADKFDEHLVKGLEYKTPSIINNILERHAIKNNNITMDLGCGTGLCCKYLRNISVNITGVDLSPGMIKKADELKCYDHLIVGEITEVINKSDKFFDLVIAADVFVYITSLVDIFHACYSKMNTDAYFIFSTETLPDNLPDDYRQFESGRCKHSTNYINQLIDNNDFKFIEHKFCILRKENGKDVNGCITVLKKTSN